MIDPVKESYIRFQGSTFHMAREDSAAYERYKARIPVKICFVNGMRRSWKVFSRNSGKMKILFGTNTIQLSMSLTEDMLI